jgi:hypothetical protein
LGVFSKKLWSIVKGQLDSYVEKTKAQIEEAENLKNETANLLQSAKEDQRLIDKEVEKIMELTQKKIDSIEEAGRKSMADLSCEYEAKLNNRIRDEILRQKQCLIENAVDVITDEITKRVRQNPRGFDFSLSKDDLLTIAKEVKTNEMQ